MTPPIPLLPAVAGWTVGLLPPIWLGMVVGISFIATSVKFKAATLTLPVALDVGRETFHFFNVLEWIMVLVLAVALWISGGIGWRLCIGILLLAIVMTQTFWILPALDARVEQIISGITPPSSYHHVVYGILEVSKASSLAAISVSAFAAMRNGYSL